ncbi:hypothetical protein [Chitinophaga defluvii]|uniref:Uncharacterized protein n=1 Tax=Chitinophaga defluvii TaxID=3163343 RepID=A0ABV2TER0_9BACT
MKQVIVSVILALLFTAVYAQDFNPNDTLILDMDFDKKTDTIIFDKTRAVIISMLSTQKFIARTSLELAFEEPLSGIRKTSGTFNGFTYFVPHMRAGYHCEFTYNKSLKKIQLTAMTRYEFGPANNDGSGESSINLLTGNYVGDWNYFDMESDELVKIPTIKRKITLPKTYLENFNDEIVYKYIDTCAGIFDKTKQAMIAATTLQRLTRASIVVRKTFHDVFGENNLQVKVINPCNTDSSIFDGALTQIEAILKNKKTTILTYRHPDAEMSLIHFVKEEIHIRDFGGKKAVFIPFYYCGGYETYDRKVSYLILYDNKKYTFHIDYYCKGAQDCKPVNSLAILLKDLSPVIRPYFITYLNKKHTSRNSFHQD